ncbi:MAG TPA: DUF4382 domain-containing protein [Puia sp.]|jgi:hypothetical protein|nr:DUF4382 domain-containing protein [Puia sp.]
MKTKIAWLTTLVGVTVVLSIASCNKSNSSNSNSNIPKGQSQLSVYMMDAPVPYDSVLIDIRQIAVEVDTATTMNAADDPNQWDNGWCGAGRGQSNKSVIWDTLNITPGVYNLLALRNGADTLLTSSLISTGKVLKIRITLGSDNKVYTDSVTSFPLVVFGLNQFFTINVSRTNVADVTNNELKLWLDFNLNRSIFYWSGTFYLNPYIVVFNDQVMAKLEGAVLPRGAGALVEAINGADTLYAIPFRTGQYQFRNVPTGTYSLTFKGYDGYQDTTVSSIVVDSMKVVQVPTVTLHK